jgi:alpha-N-arabinofuranosidase
MGWSKFFPAGGEGPHTADAVKIIFLYSARHSFTVSHQRTQRILRWWSRRLCFVLVFTAQVTSVSAQAHQTASITIDARKVENRISPLLYGQFLEFMFEGIKGGLQAEMIRNRSFEESANAIGLSRNWDRYPDDRNDDYALSFAWDDGVAYPERKNETKEHSLRVRAGDGVIPRHGVYQSRIPIRAGVEYRGYIWLRTADYAGSVTIALESDVNLGQAYAAADLEPVTKGIWRRYDFTLKPPISDPLSRFAILFQGRGTVWIDQVSLMPGDLAPGGVRRDVFEKIKLLEPAFIRWPGGNVAQDYHWQWGVGPRDERVTWTNLSWKNEPEPSEFGTDEFVAFARAVGADPSITVNVEGHGATVEEAAAWVEYCNGPATSKYGAMRAANGHSAPFGVKFWEVGNEIWGDWVRGHSDAETYARNYIRYAKAMRAVDPTIKLIAVGDNDMKWNRTVVNRAGANIDYLAIHHYYGRREMAGDLKNLMARPLFYEKFYEQVAQLLKETSPQHPIQLAINEWGLDLPIQQQYSMLSALYAARLMNVFERTNGLVAMSAVSDLVNGWPGGIIQANKDGLFISSIYLVNQLYAESLGTERLATTVKCGTFDSSREGKEIDYLDVVASRSADSKSVFIKVVNSDLQKAIPTTFSVEGLPRRTRVQIATVNSSQLNDSNSFQTPDAIKVTRSFRPVGPTFMVTLPAHSVSVLTLTLQ